MAASVVVPQAGLEVEEATVLAILVEVGQHVRKDDPLVELETDKAVTEVTAPVDGTVVAIVVSVGDTVPVGGQLVQLGSDGDALPPPHVEAPVANGAAAVDGHVVTAPPSAPTAPATAPVRRRIAPVARRAAADRGVDLDQVDGTGPRGRITLRDVKAFAEASSVATTLAVPDARPGRREPLSATRKVVARRMTQSAQIPQYALDRRIDATSLLADKRQLTQEVPGLSVTDLLIQAQAEMLDRHRDLACSFHEAAGAEEAYLEHPEDIDVGLAIATERGLLVAVVRRAQAETLGGLVAQRRRLVDAARAGRLGRDDMAGATTTLSNLGSFGVDRFAAMLNPGESTILAVGQTVDHVVPRGLTVVPTITLTLAVDHRVADGATGATALDELAALLEGKMRWRV